MSVTFIEASAGTGKTYTLVSRVVELIRRGVTAEAILLVTFTEKATDELKDRIRQGLRGEYLKTGDERLAQALEDWGSLSISTIHGFCRMLLTQFPLESGISFEPEFVDQAVRSRRLLREEIRARLSDLGTLPAWAGIDDEEKLLALAVKAINEGVFHKPLLHPDSRESAFFDSLRSELEAGAGPLWDAVRALPAGLPDNADFGPDSPLNKSTSAKPYRLVLALSRARSWNDFLDALESERDLDAAAGLAKWDTDVWKKPGPPAAGVLADLRTAACALADELRRLDTAGIGLAPFLRRCARYRLLAAVVRPALERRSDRELTYRDLIERTSELAAAGALDAAALRWKAVLIDEFQDTDQDQWEIFSRLFLRAGCELTVVGDPKQSIYRFRGADLDVYRAAREAVAGQAAFESLDANYRSTAPMIEAVNALFDPSVARWPRPEDFRPSLKGDKTIAVLKRNGRELPPIDRRWADDKADWHRHLAARVLELLEAHVLEAEDARPVTPSDILVLTRRKSEARMLAKLLESKGVPVSVGGTGGLLATREAQEIVLFLKALEAPSSLAAARALGWTRLLAGADAETLAPALHAAQDDRLRGAYLRAFRRVVAAVDGSADGGGLETLLRRPGGTRLVTNAEHILEFLQDRFHQGEIPHGQAALSLETLMEAKSEESEIEPRRDRDSAAVRIMTIHKAKGLEAPIVLHGWPDKPRQSTAEWVIAGGADFLLTPAGLAAEAASEEAEALRLRYVALTRARSYQVLFDETGEPLAPWTSEAWNALPRWTPPPPAPGPELGDAVRGLESRHPWIESHSGLWRRSQAEDEHTTWDRPAVRDAEAEDAPTLSDQLPAGAAFGDLVHDVLEAADWRGWAPGAAAELREKTSKVVDDQVQKHRSRLPVPGLSRILDRWLGGVLSQPLELGDTAVRFTDLDPAQTRRELEFHLPLGHTATRALVWGGRELTVHPGYLTGRIDLLFEWQGRLYLADWKTNRLSGQTPEQVMAEAGYDLQAQWYWEALTRLCRVQKEPLKPGGVLYVFLRGTGDRPAGVFLAPEALSSQKALSVFFSEASHG